ncbi:MAG TPA: tyrosine-type recombinase/integrase, partial [Stellaceae bacterium]|nr:tyrosine-type recombinase/integrase [Stellaceae bacterium]
SHTRIEAEYGTDAFALEVARLNAALSTTPEPPKDGTLGGLIAAYRASPEFQGLAVRTRRDYQRVCDYLKPIADTPLDRMTTSFILAVRDKANAKHKRRFANYVVQVFRLLFKWGRQRNWLEVNHAAGLDPIPRPKNLAPANRPWSDAELEAVVEHAPPSVRLAVLLGRYTGLRQGDVISFLWSGYDGRAIQVRQGKTGEPVWIPAHTRLKKALDATTRRHAVVVVGERGRPFTSNGFRGRFFKFLRKLEVDGAIGPGLTFHGLRHTLATKLAESGSDTRSIAAVLGQKTEDMARHYAKGEDQRRRATAAIKKLDPRKRSKRKKAAG